MGKKDQQQFIIQFPNKFADADEWESYGKKLSATDRGVGWLIGEWWNQGEPYGDRVERAERCGFKPEHCRNCGWVVDNVSFRNDTLTFKHHMQVAALPAPEQKKWLARAEKGDNGESWSAATLRRAIRHAQRGIQAGEKFQLAATSKLATVIYADPPWKYSNNGFEGAADDHYPPMTVEEICALPVASICAQDAALFLWVTNPLLPDGLSVMNAWGFSYKTNFVWIKDRPMNSLGFYNRGQHELLLLGTRGSFLPEGSVRALPASALSAKKSEHSRKPAEFYDLIESMYDRFIPTMRELFCRGPGRKGWLPPFGNEAKKLEEK